MKTTARIATIGGVAQTGGTGIVDEFTIGASGALTEIGSVAVPGGAGGEGIIAS